MGESACLLRSFSQPSETSREVFEGGNPIRALTESISFGRFMTESLDWDKWSMFSQNRYIEEAEKFSKPGSVAQKKAFFEAHFKKRAAMKAASLVDTGNIAVTNVAPEVRENKTNIDTLPSMDDRVLSAEPEPKPEPESVASALLENITHKKSSMDIELAEPVPNADMELTEPNVAVDEQEPKDIEVIYSSVVNNQTCDPTTAEPEAVTEQLINVERSSLVESYDQLKNGDNDKKVVVALEEKILNKEKSASSSKTRQSKSPSTSSSYSRIPGITSSRDKRATSPQPKNVIRDIASKSDKSRDEKGRPNPKSVHMSISFGSRTGDNRKTSVKSSKDCTFPPRAGNANTKISPRVPNSRNGSMYNSLHMSIDLTTRAGETTRKIPLNDLNTRQATSLRGTNKTNNVHSKRTTTIGDSDIKKRSIPNSLHMSIDLCSSSRGDKSSEPSLKKSENVSYRVQMSIQASSSARLLKRPPVNLQSVEKRSNSLVKKEVPERTKTDQKSRSSTDDMKSLNQSRGRTGSSTSSHLRFRSEGATKRSKLGDENAAAEEKKVKTGTQPKVSSTQLPSTRPPSQRFGWKPSSISDTSSSVLPRKPSVDTGRCERNRDNNNNNQTTTRPSVSLPKKNLEEKNTETTTRGPSMNARQNNIKKSTGNPTTTTLLKKTAQANEIKSSTRPTTSSKITSDKNVKRPIRPTTSLPKKNKQENSMKIPTRPTATISKRTAPEKNIKTSIRPTSSLSKNSSNERNNHPMMDRSSSSKKNEHENASPNILS